MKTLRFLLEKEFKLLFRNAFLPGMLVAFPTVMMFLLPWAADLDARDIRLGVVDRDRSPFSGRLTRELEASGYFHLVAFPGKFAEAVERVAAGDVDVVLDIPPRLDRDRERGEAAPVFIAPNGVNGMKGGLAAAYLSAIVASNQPATRPPVEVTTLYRFNPGLEYKPFMLPALMVMLAMMLCGFLPALDIAGEKESGTIEQVNVTPVGKFTFIAAKLIPYWIIGLVALAYCFLLAYLVYDVSPAGSFGAIYLFALLFGLGVAGVGLIVSNYSATMQQAMFVMFFFIMLFVLMSGFFSPVESMPDWARWIAAFNPLKYFVEVIRGVYLKGSTVADLIPQLVALSLFAAIMNAWAACSYRKSR
ncbi:MAG: ABC transporter permease [Odoribacteraceae bacterium]|jgi:ABC-2 type transport system permease protein|nr:ABC transporter permease [Odoribacteraceae bacterium]